MTDRPSPSLPEVVASGNVRISNVNEIEENREIVVGDGAFFVDSAVPTAAELTLSALASEFDPRGNSLVQLFGRWHANHNKTAGERLPDDGEAKPGVPAVLTLDKGRTGMRRITGKYAVTVTLLRRPPAVGKK